MAVKKALLVIDMQNDLCHDDRRKEKVAAIIKPLTGIIHMFHEHRQPIFYICFALAKGDEQFKRFGDVYCIDGTPGARIINELHPLCGEVIKKRKHSAFFETDLDNRLVSAGVREVFLTGLQTHICIMTTAADASFRGYRTVAVSDCVVSSRDPTKRQALNWIKKYVGEVITARQVRNEFAYIR